MNNSLKRKDYPEKNRDIQQQIHNLLVRIGELRQSTLENNISDLFSNLKPHFVHYNIFIIDTILECVISLPYKTPIYATLIGLINAKEDTICKNFFEDFIKSYQLRVEKTWKTLNCQKDYIIVRLLLRFAAELVNSHVLHPECFLNLLLEQIFPSTHEPATSAEFLIYIIMNILPWCAKELKKSQNELFIHLISQIEFFASNHQFTRNESYFPLPGCPTYLEEYYNSFIKMKDNDFENQTTLKPYIYFEQQKIEHHLPLGNGSHYSFNFSPIKVINNYQYPLLLPLSDPTPKLETSTLPQYPIDIMICQEYIVDILECFYDNPEECTKQLLMLPVGFDYRFLLIRSIFSEMLKIPKSCAPVVFFGDIIVYLFTENSKGYPPILGPLFTQLFNLLTEMDIECIDRLVRWFAYHLNHFKFFWVWSSWNKVINLPLSHPQSYFVRNTFNICLRLSYFERLVEAIPKEFSSSPLFPPEPSFQHCIKIASSQEINNINEEIVDETMKSSICARQLLGMLESKRNLDEILNWMHSSEFSFLHLYNQTTIITDCLLSLGTQSFSHSIAMIERYQPLLVQQVTEGMQLQILLTICRCWRSSTQHIEILFDKCYDLKIVSIEIIFKWFFCYEESFWKESYTYLIVQRIFDKLIFQYECILQLKTEEQQKKYRQEKFSSSNNMEIDETKEEDSLSKTIDPTSLFNFIQKNLEKFFNELKNIYFSSYGLDYQYYLFKRIRQFIRQYRKILPENNNYEEFQ